MGAGKPLKAWIIDTDNTNNSSHNMREVLKILTFWDFSFPKPWFEVLSFHCLATAPNLDNDCPEHKWKHSLRSKHVQNWLQWKWRLPWHGTISLTVPWWSGKLLPLGAVRNNFCGKCERFWHFVIFHFLKPWFRGYEFPLFGHSSKPW